MNTYTQEKPSPAVATGYIGLGSNLPGELDSPLAQLEAAIKALRQQPALQLTRRSPWYRSKAVGPGEQADYLNGVVEFKSQLPAAELLTLLHQIENQQGRTRVIRWGARTLDLDLLCYGQQQCSSPTLTLPHPRIAERNFVLAPLADLNPLLRLPGQQHTICELLQSCGQADLQLAEAGSTVLEYHP